MLKYRLYQQEEAKKKAEKVALASSQKSIDFGSQCRSYVMHPYKLVRDERSGYKTNDVQGILNGDLDAFIKATLVNNPVKNAHNKK